MVQKKQKKLYIVIFCIVLANVVLATNAHQTYQGLPNQQNREGKLKYYKSDFQMHFGNGQNILIKNDLNLEMKSGLYHIDYTKGEYSYKNPHQFNYQKYLYATQFDDVVYLSEISLEMIKIESFSWNQMMHQLYVKANLLVERKFPVKTTQEFVKGILFGTKTGLVKENGEVFRLNGTSHVLAVSGLHIGILYLVITRCLFWVKNNKTFITLLIIIIYLMFIGFPISGFRAVCMVMGAGVADQFNRKYDVLQTLALTGIILMIGNVYVVYHTGFIFSLVAVLVITVLYNGIFRKLDGYILKLILLPLSIQIGMLPLTLFYSNQLHLLSFVINLLIVPLVAVLLNLVVLIILCPLSLLLLTNFTDFLVELIYIINTLFASYEDFIVTWPSPNIYMIVMFYITLALVYEHQYRKVIKVLLLSFLISLMVYHSFVVEVYFFDVGQGDCVLIKKGSKTLLIDGGYSTEQKKLKDILLKSGISDIDYAMISHSHHDHIGGFYDIQEFLTDTIYLYKSPNELEAVFGIVDLNQRVDTTFYKEYNLGFVSINPVQYRPGNHLNDTSLVSYVSIYNTDLLLTGDIELNIEKAIQDQLKQVDILKVPHHGSVTSSTENFVSTVNPKQAVVCVGKNSYGHPSREVIERYLSVGTEVLITKRGCIKFYILPFGIYFVKQYK